MSIIHDALKKAQEERKKENIPAPFAVQEPKRRRKAFGYALAGLVLAAVAAALFFAYSGRPKEMARTARTPETVPGPQMVNQQVRDPQSVPKRSPVKETFQPSPASVRPDTMAGDEKEVRQAAKKVKATESGPPRIAAQAQVDLSKKPEEKITQDNATVQNDGSIGKVSPDPERIPARRLTFDNTDALWREAMGDIEKGETKAAEDKLRRILVKRPNHVEALNNLGVMAMERNDTDDALRYFSRLLDCRKDYPKVYNNLGLVYMKKGNTRLAEEYFLKAVALTPEAVEPYVNLAALLRSQGRHTEAAGLLESPLRKHADSPALLLAYGVAKDSLTHYDEAARCYRRYLASAGPGGERKDVALRLQYLEKLGYVDR